MKKRLVSVILSIIMTLTATLSLSGCGKDEAVTVTLYAWGGDELVNAYIDDTLAPYVKETTGVILRRVPMDAADFMVKLTNEVAAGTSSDMDLLWINGENFFSAKENDLLYGPFAEQISNLTQYVDSDTWGYDFGIATEGYEAPWGTAQFVLFYDSAKVTAPPLNTEELLNYVKANPGTFTYPQAADFTGSAFIRTVLYDLIDYDTLQNLEADHDKVKEAIQPAMDYLNEIEPYLWREGETYPSDSTQLESLYQDGEINFSMAYTAYKAISMVQSGAWPESTRTFVWDSGTPYNVHFLAIPVNSANPEAAMKVINAALSPEMQAKKADLSGWADLSVLSYAKLPDEAKSAMDQAQEVAPEYADTILSYEELSSHRRPELRADLVEIIETIWTEEVLEK